MRELIRRWIATLCPIYYILLGFAGLFVIWYSGWRTGEADAKHAGVVLLGWAASWGGVCCLGGPPPQGGYFIRALVEGEHFSEAVDNAAWQNGALIIDRFKHGPSEGAGRATP